MIRYALGCEAGHTFESWFNNSAAFDRQAARGLIACPLCGSTNVEKDIMAPALSGSREDDAPIAEPEKTPVAIVSKEEVEVLFAQAISSFVFKQLTSRREAAGIVLVVIGVALLVWARA